MAGDGVLCFPAHLGRLPFAIVYCLRRARGTHRRMFINASSMLLNLILLSGCSSGLRLSTPRWGVLSGRFHEPSRAQWILAQSAVFLTSGHGTTWPVFRDRSRSRKFHVPQAIILCLLHTFCRLAPIALHCHRLSSVKQLPMTQQPACPASRWTSDLLAKGPHRPTAL